VDGLKINPAGNNPVIDHVYGGVPLFATSEALYATPT
jgi:hypothetical protein